jgi:hypothetical protein
MSWSELFRKEWGAVTFVLTVLAGMIAVPIAFFFFHQAPGPVTVAVPNPTPSAASSAREASPPRLVSPSP